MFKIVSARGGVRVESDAKLTAAEFAEIATALSQVPFHARKLGFIAARSARTREQVETCWNGRVSTNTARVGDFVVTNLSSQRQPLRDNHGHLNIYAVGAERFADIYEPTNDTTEHGAVYRPKGVIAALPLPGGFDIMAPWGDRQWCTTAGYLLLNGEEVYGAGKEAVESTYEIVSP